jgi:hypothetical protein
MEGMLFLLASSNSFLDATIHCQTKDGPTREQGLLVYKFGLIILCMIPSSTTATHWKSRKHCPGEHVMQPTIQLKILHNS